MKLIQSNQLDINTDNEEKAKRYKAFNQNIVKLYKAPEQKFKSLNEIKANISSLQKSPVSVLANAVANSKFK